MADGRLSQLLVIDRAMQPLGFVSKRDIARFLLEDPTPRGLEDIRVREVRVNPIRTIGAGSSVHEAATMFDTENVACAAVSDDDGLVSGVLTETDLCQYFISHSPGCFKVNDFMKKEFVYAKSSYPIVHAAHLIVFKQFSVPVIDEKLVGVLTLSDYLSIPDGEPHDASNLKDKALSMRTKELMTPEPVTALPDDELANATQTMLQKGIGSLPVVNHKSNVVGLLTKHDVMKALQIPQAAHTENST